jgi:hypothetical protein
MPAPCLAGESARWVPDQKFLEFPRSTTVIFVRILIGHEKVRCVKLRPLGAARIREVFRKRTV